MIRSMMKSYGRSTSSLGDPSLSDETDTTIDRTGDLEVVQVESHTPIQGGGGNDPDYKIYADCVGACNAKFPNGAPGIAECTGGAAASSGCALTFKNILCQRQGATGFDPATGDCVTKTAAPGPHEDARDARDEISAAPAPPEGMSLPKKLLLGTALAAAGWTAFALATKRPVIPPAAKAYAQAIPAKAKSMYQKVRG
jgi:hypothetical protein